MLRRREGRLAISGTKRLIPISIDPHLILTAIERTLDEELGAARVEELVSTNGEGLGGRGDRNRGGGGRSQREQ